MSNRLRCLGFAKLDLNPGTCGSNYKHVAKDEAMRSPNFHIGNKEVGVRDGDGRAQHPRSYGGGSLLDATEDG